jgi:[ribosomal protein S5]-alanine N-acetyltransferase
MLSILRGSLVDVVELRQSGVILRGDRVVVRPPTEANANELARILREDVTLGEWLGSSTADDSFDGQQYIVYISDWEIFRDALCFAIVLRDGPAIGSISLSHINTHERTGRIGYWIASAHWRKGYTTEAFTLVADYAERIGLHHLSARIEDHNIASVKLWRRYGASERKTHDKRIEVSLDLTNRIHNTNGTGHVS